MKKRQNKKTPLISDTDRIPSAALFRRSNSAQKKAQLKIVVRGEENFNKFCNTFPQLPQSFCPLSFFTKKDAILGVKKHPIISVHVICGYGSVTNEVGHFEIYPLPSIFEILFLEGV